MNESYAACFYLEVSVHSCRITTTPFPYFLIFFFKWQSQFKSQGTKLIPDDVAEHALMYQRMFEGLSFYEKLSKTSQIFRRLQGISDCAQGSATVEYHGCRMLPHPYYYLIVF